jgi:hypothetical protein
LHDARLGFFQVLPIVLFVSAPIQANQIRYFILQKLFPSCLSFFSSERRGACLRSAFADWEHPLATTTLMG